LASAVKLTPLALLPPIAGRRWRDGAVMGGVFVGAGALAWVVAPHESVQYWFHELLGGRYGHESLVGNQSLAGLLARHPLPGPPAFTTLVLVIAMAAILVVGSWRAVRLARRGAGLSAFVVAPAPGCSWPRCRGRTTRRRCCWRPCARLCPRRGRRPCCGVSSSS
jgi:hypothetical protein